MLTNTITLFNQFLKSTDFKNLYITESDFHKTKRNSDEFVDTIIHHNVTFDNMTFPVSVSFIARKDDNLRSITFECYKLNKYNYLAVSEYLLQLMMDFSTFMNSNYDLPLFDAANIHIFSLNNLERIKNGQTKISHFTTSDHFYQFKTSFNDVNHEIHGMVRFHIHHYKRMSVSFELNH